VISPKSEGCGVQDQNSKNGTLVNGRRVTETTLKPNDNIRAGQTLFVFVEGLATAIGKLQDEPKGYRTHIREISKEAKPQQGAKRPVEHQPHALAAGRLRIAHPRPSRLLKNQLQYTCSVRRI